MYWVNLGPKIGEILYLYQRFESQTKAVCERSSGLGTLLLTEANSLFLYMTRIRSCLPILLQDTAFHLHSCNTVLEELTFWTRSLCNSNHSSKTILESKMLRSTYSNTELSFWSPHIRISVIERIVSTSRLRLWSVTVVFLVKTWYMYLKEKNNYK